jgi:hypothetical protein
MGFIVSREYGSAILKKNTIGCEVPACLAKVAHDFGEVGSHLARVHPNISMREYYNTYM